MVIDPRVSLCRLTSLTEIFASCAARFARYFLSLSCHFHTFLPFTCADGSCVSLSCTRAAIPTILNFADQSFLWVRVPLSAFTPAAALLFSLTWLCASWSAGTPRLRHVCTDRPSTHLVGTDSSAAAHDSFSWILSLHLASDSLVD